MRVPALLLAAAATVAVTAPACAEAPDRFATERACTYRVPSGRGELRSQARPLAAFGHLVLRVDGRPMDVSAAGLDLEALSAEWTTCDAWRGLDADRLVGRQLPRLALADGRVIRPAPGARLTFIYLFPAG